MGSCSSCTSDSKSSRREPARWNIPNTNSEIFVAVGAFRPAYLPDIRKKSDRRFIVFADPYGEAAYAFGLAAGEFAIVENGFVKKVTAQP